MIRGAKQIVRCKCCDGNFEAREVDIKRGWGKFCSKSCKALRQKINTNRIKANIHDDNYDPEDSEYWDSKEF